MKILIACEYSGRVRDAFIRMGHDAMSCDLLPTDSPGPHYQGDVFDVIGDGWDLMIAHPPCTHLAVSGARHFEAKRADGRQQEGIDFFLKIANAPINKIAIENPVGIMSGIYRKPSQVIHPKYFGDPVNKATCLWLKGLPRLNATNIVEPEMVTLKNGKRFSKWDYEISFDRKNRAKLRSKTFPGIAKAMAQQWGGKINATTLQK